jgi:hypothetical protein
VVSRILVRETASEAYLNINSPAPGNSPSREAKFLWTVEAKCGISLPSLEPKLLLPGKKGSRMRLGAITLTLAVALAVVGVASAEEDASPGWFSRLFGGSSPQAEAVKSEDKKAESSPRSAAKRLKQAQADFDRRIRVCLELEELADKLDDEELRRKATHLQQRAWDAYVATTGAKQLPNRPGASSDAKGTSTLEKKAKEAPR